MSESVYRITAERGIETLSVGEPTLKDAEKTIIQNICGSNEDSSATDVTDNELKEIKKILFTPSGSRIRQA